MGQQEARLEPCGSCRLATLCVDRQTVVSQLNAGVTLQRQGEEARGIVRIHSGLALQTVCDRHGEELRCVLRGPGATLNLEAVLGEETWSEVLALTELEVCITPLSVVAPHLGDPDEPGFALFQMAVTEAWHCMDQKRLRHGAAASRVARLLMSASDLLGDGVQIDPPLRTLSRGVGIRPETMSRALAQLRAAGGIEEGRPLRIRDRAVLEDLGSASSD